MGTTQGVGGNEGVWWHEAETAARNVIAARVRDHQTREDFVQETLARLLAVRPRLDDDALVPYAIVIARNLVYADARRQWYAVLDLPEVEQAEAADVEAVRLEEAAALREALRHIPASDRTVLLQRELQHVPVRTIAHDQGVNAGTMRVRLARLRGRLRVEYVLAYRHITSLPSPQCRGVLDALGTGDAEQARRRDAEAHLRTCRTCASLEPIIRQRRRGLAGILAFLGVGRLLAKLRESPRAAQVSATTAAVAVGGTIAIAALRDTPPERERPPVSTTSEAAPAQVDIAGLAWTGTDGENTNQPIVARAVRVVSASGDERFEVMTRGRDRIGVTLRGPGESPFTVVAGQRVSFRGVVADGNSRRTAIVASVEYDDLTVLPD